jgi:hypothetical protein
VLGETQWDHVLVMPNREIRMSIASPDRFQYLRPEPGKLMQEHYILGLESYTVLECAGAATCVMKAIGRVLFIYNPSKRRPRATPIRENS